MFSIAQDASPCFSLAAPRRGRPACPDVERQSLHVREDGYLLQSYRATWQPLLKPHFRPAFLWSSPCLVNQLTWVPPALDSTSCPMTHDTPCDFLQQGAWILGEMIKQMYALKLENSLRCKLHVLSVPLCLGSEQRFIG